MSSNIPTYEASPRKEYKMNIFGVSQSARRLTLAALALLFAVVVSPSTSHASTAAGTKITNTATLNYTDSAGNGQPQKTASAEVTVTLVPSAVNITRDISTVSVIEGAATLVTYTVSGTANGKDSYNITSTETASNMSNENGNQVITPASITLAGTSLAVAAADGNTSITVPLDSSGSYSATGLVAGAVGTGTLLKIGTNTYTVLTITPDAGTNTMALGLSAAISGLGAPLGIGTIISEQRTFTVSYPTGTVTSTGTATQTGTATVTSTSTGTPATTSGTTVITVTAKPVTLDLSKKACNTTVDATGGAACFNTTANAAPGNTIIYKVVVTNAATNTGTAKAVVIADIIQKYLTYVGSSAKFATGLIGTPSALSYNSGSLTGLEDGTVVADGYTYTAATKAVSYAFTGTLAPGSELVLFYTATVNN